MKCIFLYNPTSGKGKIKKRITYIEETLRKKYSVVDVYETTSAEDLIKTSKEACNNYDAIIFSGGDGTFNDVACGVSMMPNRPVLGYIPSGTVNDIARNLKIPRNIKKALKIITDGYKTNHDVGRINDGYFIYVASIGTFTDVSYRTKQTMKRIYGRLAYAFDGLKQIANPSLSKIKLIMEETEVELDSPLLLIMNSITIAGIPLNRGGHLNDGSFDVMIVKKGIHKGVINILRLFLHGLFRLKPSKKLVDYYKASKIVVEVDDDLIWSVDGEAGPKGRVVIENIHNHIQVYVPENKYK